MSAKLKRQNRIKEILVGEGIASQEKLVLMLDVTE